MLLLGILIAGVATQVHAQHRVMVVEQAEDNGESSVNLNVSIQHTEEGFVLKATRTENNGEPTVFEKTYAEKGEWHQDPEFMEFAGESFGDHMGGEHIMIRRMHGEEGEHAIHLQRLHEMEGLSEEERARMKAEMERMHQELEGLSEEERARLKEEMHRVHEQMENEMGEVRVRIHREAMEGNREELERMHLELMEKATEAGEHTFDVIILEGEEGDGPMEFHFRQGGEGEDNVFHMSGENFVWKTESGIQIVIRTHDGEAEVIELDNDAFEKAHLQNGKPFAPDVLSVFPNPSEGNFTVQVANDFSEAVEVRVISLTGQEVYRQSFDKESAPLMAKIDLQGQEAGVYILQAIQGERVSTRKIIIE